MDNIKCEYSSKITVGKFTVEIFCINTDNEMYFEISGRIGFGGIWEIF